MDLRKDHPRSPRERLGPFVWLPRLIDKARAALAGTLGEYSYNCPVDQKLLAFLGITADAFKAAVEASGDDAAILAWVKKNMRPRGEADVARFNDDLAGAGPANEPGETWFKRIDREEGRLA